LPGIRLTAFAYVLTSCPNASLLAQWIQPGHLVLSLATGSKAYMLELAFTQSSLFYDPLNTIDPYAYFHILARRSPTLLRDWLSRFGRVENPDWNLILLSQERLERFGEFWETISNVGSQANDLRPFLDSKSERVRLAALKLLMHSDRSLAEERLPQEIARISLPNLPLLLAAYVSDRPHADRARAAVAGQPDAPERLATIDGMFDEVTAVAARLLSPRVDERDAVLHAIGWRDDLATLLAGLPSESFPENNRTYVSRLLTLRTVLIDRVRTVPEATAKWFAQLHEHSAAVAHEANSGLFAKLVDIGERRAKTSLEGPFLGSVTVVDRQSAVAAPRDYAFICQPLGLLMQQAEGRFRRPETARSLPGQCSISDMDLSQPRSTCRFGPSFSEEPAAVSALGAMTASVAACLGPTWTQLKGSELNEVTYTFLHGARRPEVTIALAKRRTGDLQQWTMSVDVVSPEETSSDPAWPHGRGKSQGRAARSRPP